MMNRDVMNGPHSISITHLKNNCCRYQRHFWQSVKSVEKFCPGLHSGPNSPKPYRSGRYCLRLFCLGPFCPTLICKVWSTTPYGIVTKKKYIYLMWSLDKLFGMKTNLRKVPSFTVSAMPKYKYTYEHLIAQKKRITVVWIPCRKN